MLGLHPVRLPVDVGFEQPDGLGDEVMLVGDHPKAAAMVDVEEGEVKRQQVERPPVDDHHLAVITNQVLGRARNLHTALYQAAFQLSDLFQPFFIGVSDQGVDADAAGGGGDQLLLDLKAVEAIEYDLYALFRPSDSLEKRLNAVAWLNDNLHYDYVRSAPPAIQVRYLAAA